MSQQMGPVVFPVHPLVIVALIAVVGVIALLAKCALRELVGARRPSRP